MQLELESTFRVNGAEGDGFSRGVVGTERGIGSGFEALLLWRSCVFGIRRMWGCLLQKYASRAGLTIAAVKEYGLKHKQAAKQAEANNNQS
ncbi:MAG: hypothetical protein ACYSR5_05205 [Planctomycetota bacterium]